ncbi:15784_t:CDS:2, partial [Racocetra fulgida]
NQKFTNNAKCVKSYLNQCEYFKNAHSLEEQEEIFNQVNPKSLEVVIAEAKAIKKSYSANMVIPSNENENLHETMFYDELNTKETQDLLDDWQETINNWIKSLEYENLTKLAIQQYFDIDIDSECNEFVERSTHTVYNPTAKWKLAELFIEDLEAPHYFYQSENA